MHSGHIFPQSRWTY